MSGGRWSIGRATVVMAASVAVWSACDDAILGVRSLDCDGGACSDADVHDGGADGDSGACTSLEPPACEAGAPVERRDGGCVVAYVCEATCASRGGTCKTLAACGGGRWSPDASADCVGAPDLGCCGLCPPIAAPPADYCDGGTIVEVREGACTVGFACQ